ncbi:MAG: amidohydrolase [Chloroflexi bacterium]|nr:amidohydrolase [Chloroflexota bacterium]
MLEHARMIEEQLIAWRREFHMHPELGFEETRTAARVAEILEPLGYRIRTGVGRTGVVADLGEGHPIVGIRADMDALPIQDGKDVPYASQVPGIMHACGHDAHVAALLGVATLLSQETFPGTVRLLFQPSEEKGDAESISGAPRMVEDGAMEGVDTVLALHVDSGLATGDITVGSGPVSAGVDSFYATITGKGGHGAMPHKTVDPVHITGQVILALHGIVSRRLHPVAPAVISIGSIHGGDAPNVIPEQVELSGTIRYMDTRVRDEIHVEIERALGVARSLGGDYALRFRIGGPPMINNAKVTALIEKVGADLLGDDHVLPFKPEMGGEDFGAFSDLAPGAMFMLGCRIEGDEREHHNPRFDIDERCLPLGTAILTEAALRLLKHKD